MNVDSASTAARRRQRRLRSWLRHERMTVAMTLAEMSHHTALRELTMARVEEVEKVTHDGLWAQMTPPRGERPGCLSDPGPQRSDRTVRHSAGEAPALSPPSPADAAADVVDNSSLAFLLKASLSQRRKEEEEEGRRVKMEQDKAVMEEWRERRKVLKAEFVALMALPSLTPLQVSRSRELVEALEAHDALKPSSGSSRRNKKRKKKKLSRGGRAHR